MRGRAQTRNVMAGLTRSVMAGFIPAIHVCLLCHPRLACCDVVKPWMPGTRPGMTPRALHVQFLLLRSSLRRRSGERDGSGGLLAPEARRGDVGAAANAGELEPDHRLDDPLALGEGAESAIGRGNDALTVADGADGFLDPARHH